MRLKLFGKEIYIPVFLKIIGACFPVVLLIALGFYLEKSGSLTPGVFEKAEASPAQEAEIHSDALYEAELTKHTETAEAIETPAAYDTEEEKVIRVYIVGEIVNSDVYILPETSLIIDLIEAAGGVTENADLEAVNLAYPLQDNMMINIPSVNDGNENENWLIDSGKTAQGLHSYTNTDTEQKSSLSLKININTADLAALCTLPGIGESTAQKIIDYRLENGRFVTISDIKNVPGIKDAKYEKIKNYITVD